VQLMTFKKLRDQAYATKSEEINEIAGNAEVNANDTVYTEKTAPVAQWDAIAMGTIADQLSSGRYSTKTVLWFTKRGVIF
jgi:hypothetical protein